MERGLKGGAVQTVCGHARARVCARVRASLSHDDQVGLLKPYGQAEYAFTFEARAPSSRPHAPCSPTSTPVRPPC
eukprot:6180513-Pleurochrysis_carterae.AAC.1